MKKIILAVFTILLFLIGIIAFRTITAPNLQLKAIYKTAPALNSNSLKHFQQSINFKTISFADAKDWDSIPFINFKKFLEKTYPLVHLKLEREIINNYTYLYKWQGSNNSLKPYILMAHQDVVPIEEATKNLWTCEPFAGAIKDNFIWGRGTVDDKINLISILESAEKLLQQNFQPTRTIYFAFGHDEEIGGKNGALKIAQLLKQRNINADMVLDEGGILTKEKVPGTTKSIALVGTAEKGYLSLELSVNKEGGHSSMPANETSIDILGNALVKIRAKPFDAKFSTATKDFIKFLGPEMGFPNNVAFANTWLFKPIIISIYAKENTGNAMIRTTGVPTIINAGIKDNVVPALATAIVNFRLLPGDSSNMVIKKIKEIIDDKRVQIKNYGSDISEGSATSSAYSAAFRTIDSIAKVSFDNIATAPFLMIGATDSRHFSEVSRNIYKFSPMIDPIGFHGIDERISIESYQHSLWFFEQLMRSCK